jgi:type VI protein secretion system component VasF
MTLSTHNGKPCAYASQSVADAVKGVSATKRAKSRLVAPWLVLGAFLALFIVASVLGVLMAGDLA